MRALPITVHLVFLSMAAAADGPVLSVCEALRQRHTLNGRMVAIRGPVVGVEGALLVGDGCRFAKGDELNEWEPDISLANSRGGTELTLLDFETDFQSLTALDRQARRNPPPKRLRMYVTYYGRFETYADLAQRRRKMAHGGTVTAGFGHMGAAPAQLIIQSGRDLRYAK